MSKSLGNSPDPIELMNKYGADGVRTGMLFSSPAGNDLLFDEKLCEQGRNFSNKIWNAYRLVDGWEIDDSLACPNPVAIEWFESKFNQALTEVEDHFSKFRISDALMTSYKLVWNDFCSLFLEMVKPEYGKPIDKESYNKTIHYFKKVVKLLHPFMPFLTEEIWQAMNNRDNDYLIVAEWPSLGNIDEALLTAGDEAFEVISQIRNLRNSKQLSPKAALSLMIRSQDHNGLDKFASIITKMSNLTEITYVTDKPENASGFVIKGDEFFIPLSEEVDAEKEKEDLQKELEYAQGFFNSVNKKLSNDRFVNNAPEQVILNERKKLADAEAKIKALEEQLSNL
jgi:valyl-tRNA synthetase